MAPRLRPSCAPASRCTPRLPRSWLPILDTARWTRSAPHSSTTRVPPSDLLPTRPCPRGATSPLSATSAPSGQRPPLPRCGYSRHTPRQQLQPLQVHPAKLTKALRDAAQSRGVRIITGTCVGLEIAPPPETTGGSLAVQGVVVDGHGVVKADAVVLAMGPWTGHAARWIQEALPAGTPHPFPQLHHIEVGGCLS